MTEGPAGATCALCALAASDCSAALPACKPAQLSAALNSCPPGLLACIACCRALLRTPAVLLPAGCRTCRRFPSLSTLG